MNLKFIKEHVRASYNAVLPASVRYDINLTDKAKLIYAELTASMGHLGYTDLDNKYFAALFGVSERTISQHITNLFDRKYIDVEIVHNNIRRIKLPSMEVSFVQPPKLSEDVNIVSEEEQKFLDDFIDLWEDRTKAKYSKAARKSYYKKILTLLQTFTQEELISALEARVDFVKHNEWHQLPQNVRHITNIDLLIRDEETFLKSLRMVSTDTSPKQPPSLTSFDFT